MARAWHARQGLRQAKPVQKSNRDSERRRHLEFRNGPTGDIFKGGGGRACPRLRTVVSNVLCTKSSYPVSNVSEGASSASGNHRNCQKEHAEVAHALRRLLHRPSADAVSVGFNVLACPAREVLHRAPPRETRSSLLIVEAIGEGFCSEITVATFNRCGCPEQRVRNTSSESRNPQQNRALAATSPTDLASNLTPTLQDHPDLTKLIESWPQLPEDARSVILRIAGPLG